MGVGGELVLGEVMMIMMSLHKAYFSFVLFISAKILTRITNISVPGGTTTLLAYAFYLHVDKTSVLRQMPRLIVKTREQIIETCGGEGAKRDNHIGPTSGSSPQQSSHGCIV